MLPVLKELNSQAAATTGTSYSQWSIYRRQGGAEATTDPSATSHFISFLP